MENRSPLNTAGFLLESFHMVKVNSRMNLIACFTSSEHSFHIAMSTDCLPPLIMVFIGLKVKFKYTEILSVFRYFCLQMVNMCYLLKLPPKNEGNAYFEPKKKS